MVSSAGGGPNAGEIRYVLDFFAQDRVSSEMIVLRGDFHDGEKQRGEKREEIPYVRQYEMFLTT